MSLPLLRTADGDESAADVRIGTLLGEGGMGRVFAAQQVALGREVAVKVLRDGGRPGDVDALLREALIAARLEHPNVVPVYLLGRGEDGAPIFVMRRIEGVPWSEVLRDASLAPGLFAGTGDPLDMHLRVLLEVCGAVQFAHSRGIVHLDLKPENVMLGPYGEVYVVDWGIARSSVEDPRLPRALDRHGIVGTPTYMAPEMALGDNDAISPRTDVYLLGAVLFRVLTGAPPHAVGDLVACVEHAARAPALRYPEAAAPDLVAVCRRAMQRDPGARYPSAEALRRAVQECLRHRGSWALSAEADRRARALAEAIARVHDGADPAETSRVQALATECRFGYRQALAAWEDNEAAREGLQSALEMTALHALSRGDLHAAEELVTELPRPSAPLAARVAETRAALAAEAARVADLERFQKDADVTLGAATRNRLGTLTGSLWGAASLVVGWLDRSGRWRFGPREGIVAAALFALMCMGLVTWLRRHTPVNDVQSRFLTLLQTCAWGFVNHWVLCWALGVSMHASTALFLLWLSGGWAMAALLYDRRLGGGAVALGLGAVAVALLPHAIFEAFGGAIFMTYAMVLRPPRWLQRITHEE